MPKPHIHTKRDLLTQNDSHTHNVFYSRTTIHMFCIWFANTKHHSQTNAFCFRNKYSMFYTYKETFLQLQKNIQVQTKIFQVQTKIFQAQKKILQVQNTEI
jgi:hypothetical protein